MSDPGSVDASQTGIVDDDDLLAAIQAFLKQDVVPELKGHAAFNARIAANALGIVQRSRELSNDIERLDARARDQFDFNCDATVPVTVQLSRALAEGAVTVSEELFDYLKRRQLLVTAINNPRYASRVEAVSRWCDPPVDD